MKENFTFQPQAENKKETIEKGSEAILKIEELLKMANKEKSSLNKAVGEAGNKEKAEKVANGYEIISKYALEQVLKKRAEKNKENAAGAIMDQKV